MTTELEKVHTWEIDNFEDQIVSDYFPSGGCYWSIGTYTGDGNLSLHLIVYESNPLGVGWKIKASYYFDVYDEAGKNLGRSPETSRDFCEKVYYTDLHCMFPLSKLGIMKTNKVTIKVYMNILEVHQGKPTVNCYGFLVLFSQLKAVTQIFVEHPDVINDENFITPKNQPLKSFMVQCMTDLLGLIETLNKPPQSLSDTDLSKADGKLKELTEVGFKLDWLVTKLALGKQIIYQAQTEAQIKDLELILSRIQAQVEKMKSAADKK